MNETARILCAIPADKAMDFSDFLKAIDLQDHNKITPIMTMLRTLEEQGLVTIEGTCSPITFLQLTDLGAERAREVLQEAQR